MFEGIVGGGYLSDIAIDEVKIEGCGGGGGGDGGKCLHHFASFLKQHAN